MLQALVHQRLRFPNGIFSLQVIKEDWILLQFTELGVSII